MRYITTALALTALYGCSQETRVTQPGDQLGDLRPPNLRYRITKLPTLEGAGTSQGGGINNLGWVAGYSPTTTGARHAALWRDGVVTDLLTLGGRHSNVQWPGINNNGMVVGISHTANLDPYNEDWSCSAFIPKTGEICRGFFWENGVMTELPTLGGTNGFAAGVNNRGQVVGWAENTFQDPTCVETQIFQFRAVLWDPRNGTKQALPPYPGDATSAATAINERGQVVGISGECDVAVGRKSATHALLWDHGTITNLGTLGGDFWHTPMAINERGDVVGFSNPPGGDLDGDDFLAFLWTRAGGMTNLGKLTEDGSSQALDINAQGQIVGVSCGDVLCTAILWQNGVRFKLKDLVEPALADHLWSARSINDTGVITGRLIEAGTGKRLAYIATPIAAPSAVASHAP